MISNPVIMLDWTALSSHVTGTIRYNGFLGIHSSMKIISRRELIITDNIITAYGRCIETVELSTDAGSRWCWSASVVLVSSVSASRHRKEEDPVWYTLYLAHSLGAYYINKCHIYMSRVALPSYLQNALQRWVVPVGEVICQSLWLTSPVTSMRKGSD